MVDRHTLERDIDEVLGALTAEARPRDIDRDPTSEPVQAFEDMRDLLEGPDDSDEEGSQHEDGSGEDEDDE